MKSTKFLSQKSLIIILTLVIILLCRFSSIYCLPEGESVEGNIDPATCSFDRSVANTLTVSTSLDKLIINYQSFNIAAGELVNFIQPNAGAAVLNRVSGAGLSSIYGSLTATGNIFLVNPSGINFGPTANINVASLVASTLDISNQDFLSGNYNFFKNGENAFLLNQGEIHIRNGGYVCLLSQGLENRGLIQADLGTIVLASGETMTLALDDLQEISVVISEPVKGKVLDFEGKKVDSAIKNSGSIAAHGGKVILSAKVLNNVFDYAINNSGVIEAKSLVNHNGVVELIAEGSGVLNRGQIITDGTLRSPDGGRVTIKAAVVLQQGTISANAQEKGSAGEILIVSSASTCLDTGSTTEAKTLGLVGNGGRIIIDSSGGKTIVRNGAVIDVSSGAISGNAGYIEVSAFDQIGFYGVLNGRAPPIGKPATVLFKYHSTQILPVIIISDKPDYAPDEKPIISGSGFSPDQEITLNIFSPDGTYITLTTTADSQGQFALTYMPPSLMEGAYFVIGTDGARSAVAKFTDAPLTWISVSVNPSSNLVSGSTGIFTIDISIISSNGPQSVESVEISMASVGTAQWGTLVAAEVTFNGSGTSGWVVDSSTAGLLRIKTTVSGHTGGIDPGETLTVTFSLSVPSISSSPANSLWTIRGFSNDNFSGPPPLILLRTATQNMQIVFPPDTLITSGPSGWINVDSAIFQWTGIDYDVPPLELTYSYKMDAGAWSPFATDTATTLSSLSEGTHTFYVKAKNFAGIEDPTPDTRTFGVDLTPPIITASYPAANANGWHSSDVTVKFSATDNLSGFAPAGALSVTDYNIQTTSGEGNPIGVISLGISDRAGNPAVLVNVSLNIDKTKPQLTFNPQSPLANVNGWNNTDVTISYTTTDNLSGVDTSLPLSPLYFTAEGAGLTQSVTVTDKAGNSQAFFSPAVNIDKTKPTITVTSPTDGATYTSAQTLAYTVTDSLSGVDSLTGPVSGTVYSAPGTHSVNILATDKAGNSTAASLGFNISSAPTPTAPLLLAPHIETLIYKFPILEQLIPGGTLTYQVAPADLISSSDLTSSMLHYHPLTETDTAAFDSIFTLGEGAYNFINGIINISGHDGLLPILEGLKKK